jgi:hypothetical protein
MVRRLGSRLRDAQARARLGVGAVSGAAAFTTGGFLAWGPYGWFVLGGCLLALEWLADDPNEPTAPDVVPPADGTP